MLHLYNMNQSNTFNFLTHEPAADHYEITYLIGPTHMLLAQLDSHVCILKDWLRI